MVPPFQIYVVSIDFNFLMTILNFLCVLNFELIGDM